MDPGPSSRRIGRSSVIDDPIVSIGAASVLPVVTVDDADDAVPLATALEEGGLSVVEVTLRSDAGLSAIAAIASANSTCCVGAGSVTTAVQAEEAIDAGARFLVSPGLDEGVVSVALERQIAVLPGIATATELMAAVARGVRRVKVFPAEQVGGVAAIRAFSAVWPNVQFVPTGGVKLSNVADYLAHDAVLAVGGTWIAPRELIASADWNQITANARAASTLASGRGSS